MDNDNKNIIKGFDDKRVLVDSEHSFPGYLLNYLWDFGIEYDNQNYFYKEEKLNILVEDNKINFVYPSISNIIATVDTRTNEVYFGEDKIIGSVRELDYYGGLKCAVNDRQYFFIVYSDKLGNITISYNHCDLVSIRIGEKHQTSEEYLKMVQDHIDSEVSIAIDFRILCTILNDPRIVTRLEELMKDMAPDIETAYQRRVNKIKSTCNDKITELLKNQENDIRELTLYTENYLKELENNAVEEKGSKGRA